MAFSVSDRAEVSGNSDRRSGSPKRYELAEIEIGRGALKFVRHLSDEDEAVDANLAPPGQPRDTQVQGPTAETIKGASSIVIGLSHLHALRAHRFDESS